MDDWRIWDADGEYGEIFFKRATSQLEEMESSKAAARLVSDIVEEADTIADIGCGGGHYLVSLDNALKTPFSYSGYDATENYIKLARKAFLGAESKGNPLRQNTVFEVGDIYNLPLQDRSADIVMCNNLLTHLPSIDIPIRELWRIARKYVIIRTLVGKTSFIIKQILEPEQYREDGGPVHYYYLNIYSEKYVNSLIDGLEGVVERKIFADTAYASDKVSKVNYAHGEAPSSQTTVVDGMQVCGHIIMPWHFIVLEKERAGQ